MKLLRLLRGHWRNILLVALLSVGYQFSLSWAETAMILRIPLGIALTLGTMLVIGELTYPPR